MQGKVVATGGLDLITRIDQEGYDWVYDELGLEQVEEEVDYSGIIGTCAVKDALGDKNE